MRYLYTITLGIVFILLQLKYGAASTIALNDPGSSSRENMQSEYHQVLEARAFQSLQVTPEQNKSPDKESIKKPYGLHYSENENTWTLYAAVLQLKQVSVYGRPGEIAQIEYSLDGQERRQAWTIVRMDNYSFVGDDTGAVTALHDGQNVQLLISGTYVSSEGVDWEKCVQGDTYCDNAGFIEGGFPKSEDYNGLTLCPSNLLIRSGYAEDDWINGMLAWKIKLIPNT